MTACITKIEGQTIRVWACHCFYLMCGISWAFVAMELNQYLSLWRSTWRGYLKIKEILHRYRVCTVAVELYVKRTWAPTVTWCLVRSHSDLFGAGRDETVTERSKFWDKRELQGRLFSRSVFQEFNMRDYHRGLFVICERALSLIEAAEAVHTLYAAREFVL